MTSVPKSGIYRMRFSDWVLNNIVLIGLFLLIQIGRASCREIV